MIEPYNPYAGHPQGLLTRTDALQFAFLPEKHTLLYNIYYREPTMHNITLGQRLRYKFDNTMSRGTVALIAWLLLITVSVVTIMAGLVVISGVFTDSNWVPEKVQQLPFTDALWNTLMRAMDAGTVAGDTGTWVFKLTMFGVTLFGIFVVSILIGLLTSGIEAKLDELRKGRSFVVEQDHSVILGWSEQIFTVISELVVANANRKSPCIVALADKDKVEMEDAIRSKLVSLGNTRLVCRTGSPIDMTDLQMVNPHDARSIVVLPPEDAADPDTHVIKTILALTNHPDRRKAPYHIVAPIREPKNLPVAQMVGKDEVELAAVTQADDFIVSDNLISLMLSQLSENKSLGAVFADLFSADGSEIYLKPIEDYVVLGQPMGFYTLMKAAADRGQLAIGYRIQSQSREADKAFGVVVNPNKMESITFTTGDKLIVLAED